MCASPPAAEALRLVREVPPDLILLDILMPEMDLRGLPSAQGHPSTRNIPIIFLTAKGAWPTRPWDWPSARWTISSNPSASPLSRPGCAPTWSSNSGAISWNAVHARRADRHRQPPPVRRHPGEGLAPGPAPTPPRFAHHGRHRPLQGLQRHLRPHGRRRMPTERGWRIPLPTASTARRSGALTAARNSPWCSRTRS